MAVFTTVTESELGAWLKDYSLGQLLELKGIASGIENTNYFVTTSNGRFVLTLFEVLAPAELPFYLNLMAHLARHGIPCPAPMANHQNRFLGELNGKPACIVSRLSGQSLLKPEARHCATVGAMLGQMHNAGQSFNESMQNPRGLEWRARTMPRVLPYLSQADAAMLQEEVGLHEKHPLNALPQGVIHADLFRDNVLFDGDRIGGLIDFYFACTGPLLYDVAITVNDWCVDAQGALDADKARALLAAYHAVRPFTAEEHAAWPRALRVAALRFWMSRLYDLNRPRDGELINPHDPEHFRRILLNHRAGNSPVWL